MTPTSRTLEYLRKAGYSCETVERYVKAPFMPGGGYRKDYLSIIDIIAINDTETIGIQAFSTAWSAHWQKLTVEEAENSHTWLACPNRRLFMYGWRKLKVKRGGKLMRWTARIQEITLKDLELNS